MAGSKKKKKGGPRLAASNGPNVRQRETTYRVQQSVSHRDINTPGPYRDVETGTLNSHMYRRHGETTGAGVGWLRGFSRASRLGHR